MMRFVFRQVYVCSMAVLLLGGCHPRVTTEGVDRALELAKDNRSELFKVIEHYKEDSLKLKAAFFLLENMPDKYYLAGRAIDEYYTFIDSVYQIRQEEYDIPAIYEAFIRQAEHLKEDPVPYRYVEHLSADYLIKNIDAAFQIWDKPWNRHLDFETFCELLLPYRVATEIPEEWRDAYQARFATLLTDSIRTAREACTVINDEFIKLPIHLANSSVLSIDLRPTTLFDMKFGLCGDYASLAVYAMRSVGIPVGKETVPHWGKGNQGHVFNFVYDNDGTFHDFSGAEQNPDDHLIRFRHEMPKVYRSTFGKQMNSLAMLHDSEEIPPFFRNPYRMDVTGNYPFIEAKEVVLTLDNPYGKRFAYLCVFDPQGWFPVAWTTVEADGRAVFKDMGPDIVYHAAYFEEGKIQPTGHPFLLDTLGQVTPFVPQPGKRKLALDRKNPINKGLLYLPPLMVGCQFQGADNPEFRHPVTFHIIAEKPDFKYTTAEVQASQSVKYVRYRSSDQTWGNMSEVEFYAEGSDTPLSGKVIGGYIPSMYYPRNGAANMFDGDPLTFFHSNDTLSWGGLELEQPARISRIRYLIRNDDNGIRKGHEYELFYMDNGQWNSLGKQVAVKDDEIVYNDVPEGALYWLRDYTRGVEERIFGVENGTVIWY